MLYLFGLVGVYGGHEQHSFYIKTCLSGDGNYLLSGSSDDHAYIWRIGGGPKPLLKLDGHRAEVTCVAWSSNDITKVFHFIYSYLLYKFVVYVGDLFFFFFFKNFTYGGIT